MPGKKRGRMKHLAIDSYGILLWVMCMDQLETQNSIILWIILRFLAYRMPTEIAMAMMDHYSGAFARFDPLSVDEIGRNLAGCQTSTHYCPY